MIKLPFTPIGVRSLPHSLCAVLFSRSYLGLDHGAGGYCLMNLVYYCASQGWFWLCQRYPRNHQTEFSGSVVD